MIALIVRRAPFVIAMHTTLLVGVTSSLVAQELTDDMVGQNEQAWFAWTALNRSLERSQFDEAATILNDLGDMNLSPLRLALMANRTGTLRLDQWAKKDDAPAVVRGIAAKVGDGRKQSALAEDGWHYAAIGRFKWADAAFKALDESNPDAVALLELARRNPNRHDILVKLLGHTEVGPAAQRFLELLEKGEELLRTDPQEIVVNIGRLGGPPRMVYNASNRLKASGEHAVPHLIQALQDSARNSLHPVITQVIPKIGRAALNPLCVTLEMSDDVTKGILINAIAQIGYEQGLPYLAKLVHDEEESEDIRAAAGEALVEMGSSSNLPVARAFHALAQRYYENIDSLKADPRSDTANVWYLRGDELRFVPVPQTIFNDVMAMRCSEEALLADPNLEQATAQWLAANFRREAKLGLDVQNAVPDPLANRDLTRPPNYPRAIYFARAAGAKYCHMVLALAFRDRDPGVALGAIAALAETAGEQSLVGAEDLKQPLVQTLNFPNRRVRIEAALALGRALPETMFSGAEKVLPVLSEALVQTDRRAALVIDPDDDLRNRFQALLRSVGFDCEVGANLFEGLRSAKDAGLFNFDVILLASDAQQPEPAAAISELRRNFETSATPVLILTKEDDLGLATGIARDLSGVEVLLADVVDLGDPNLIQEQVTRKLEQAAQALGMPPLDRDLALRLALRAADVLRRIAESTLSVYDFTRAEPALLTALRSRSEALRIRAAHTLALVPDGNAQAAITETALNSTYTSVERIAAFGSLAESARRNGNLLGDRDVVGRLIEFTMNERDLVLRAAASKALGALNLPGNKASEIIRAQYKG